MSVTTFPMISLDGPKVDMPILEKVAAAFTETSTFIRSPSEAVMKVRERRRRILRGDAMELQKVNKEIFTKAAVGVGSSFLLGAPFKTIGTVGRSIIKNPTVSKFAAGTGAVALFAPKTFKRFVKTEGAVPTAIASAINPLAGFIVGLEKGTGLLSSGIKEFKNNPSFQNASKFFVPAAALTAAGLGGVAAARKFIPKGIPKIPKIPSSFHTTGSSAPVAGSVQGLSSSPVIEAAPKPKETGPKPQQIKITNKPEINIALAF